MNSSPFDVINFQSGLKFKVISDSMAPVININDELKIDSNWDKLSPLDIILFNRDKCLVVHFIWRNQLHLNSTLITRSLKNFYNDEPPVDVTSVIGRVTNFNIPFYLKVKIVFLNFIFGNL